MKRYKDPVIKVNICWEIGDERKCVTLDKSDAYRTREWVESQGGCTWWFQALPN